MGWANIITAMGNILDVTISKELEQKINEIFDLMDVDKSGSIDRKETLNFW